MELSTRILSQINDAAQVTRLTRLLAQIRRDINRKRMCMLQGIVNNIFEILHAYMVQQLLI